MREFVIELSNGVINSKSKFSFKVFNALLDTNVRYSLLIYLLQQVGVTPVEQEGETSLEIENAEKYEKFGIWLCDKLEYQNKKNTTVKVETI
jgi:hypothetical protein